MQYQNNSEKRPRLTSIWFPCLLKCLLVRFVESLTRPRGGGIQTEIDFETSLGALQPPDRQRTL